MKKVIEGRVYKDQFQEVFIPNSCNVAIDVKVLASVMGVEFDAAKQYKITIEERVPKSGTTVIIDERSSIDRG